MRAVDEVVRQIAAFHLPHLAAQHLVVHAGGAVEVDVPNVDAVLRVHEERDRGRLLLLVEIGQRTHLRERVAVLAEPGAHRLLGEREQVLRERLARLHDDHVLEVLLGHDHLADELHVGDRVALPFRHADRDENVALVRGDRDLDVVPAEVREAAVHVERLEFLQVALERLLRVTVVLLDEREPVAGVQLEAREDLLVGERRIADDVHLADLRAVSLDDIDRDAHFVVAEVFDVRRDFRAVLAAAVVLLGQRAGHVLEHRAVERLALREADVRERFLQVVVLDVLVARELELRDRRPLEHEYDERVAVLAKLDVLKEAGLEERADRLARPLLIDAVADVYRQIVVDRAFGDPLRAFDAEVADDERIESRARREGRREARERCRELRQTPDAHDEPNILVRSL